MQATPGGVSLAWLKSSTDPRICCIVAIRLRRDRRLSIEILSRSTDLLHSRRASTWCCLLRPEDHVRGVEILSTYVRRCLLTLAVTGSLAVKLKSSAPTDKDCVTYPTFSATELTLLESSAPQSRRCMCCMCLRFDGCVWVAELKSSAPVGRCCMSRSAAYGRCR